MMSSDVFMSFTVVVIVLVCASKLVEVLCSCCSWCCKSILVSLRPVSQRAWLHCWECDGERCTGGVMDGVSDVGGLFEFKFDSSSVMVE